MSLIELLRRRANRSAGARNLLLLVGLALIWGSSFMLIKVAVGDLEPSTLVLGRVAFAALALCVFVPLSLGSAVTRREVRTYWPALVLVGLLNTALPFWLLSWGETRVDSGLASIIQASVPIFVAVIAFAFFHEQRVTGPRLAGVAIGFVGVALLVAAQPEGKLLGALAIVCTSVCYACGGLLARRHLAGTRPQVVALATTVVATIALLPGGLAQAPGAMPSWKAVASVAFLGLAGTALAYVLYFTLVASAGASYAALVTYLVPPIALFYGAVFLDERFGAAALGGLALILGGVALGTGSLSAARLRRRPPAQSTEPSDPADTLAA